MSAARGVRTTGVRVWMHRAQVAIAWFAVCAGLMSPSRARADAAPTTGDAWVDATLADIGRYAARYPDAFADEVARYQMAPRELVVELIGPGHWPAGEVYFACALARIAAQPCRAVVALRTQEPSPDWPALEQRLGVGPESTGFHQLKRGIVATYARWARPLQVDASLHAEFPKLPLQTRPPAPAAIRSEAAHAPPAHRPRAR